MRVIKKLNLKKKRKNLLKEK